MDKLSSKKKPGRPPLGGVSATVTMRTRITPEQHDLYSKAAELGNVTMSAWVKKNLDRAAKRDLKD